MGPPIGQLLAGAFERSREPILGVLYLNYTPDTEFSASNHGASLPHHGIAGVG